MGLIFSEVLILILILSPRRKNAPKKHTPDPNLVRQPHPPQKLHRPSIRKIHLRPLPHSLVLIHQSALDPMLGEVQRSNQTRWSSANN